MPTESRSVFIIVNIARRPLCASPTSQPWAPSNAIAQVAEALMPILCSIAVQLTPLRAPSEPSSFTRNFGTTKSEIPFTPGGASGSRASTRWMMFSVRSCSPAEMKILLPVSAI